MVVKVKGYVMTGVTRGADLVSIFYPRLIHLLKCKPYKGTLDVKLEKAIDTRPYAAMFVDRVMMNGERKIDLYVVPINLRFKGTEDGKEKNIEIRCWIIRQERSVHKDDIAEILCADNLKKKYGLDDGDGVEIEITTEKRFRKENIAVRSVKRLYGLQGGDD